MKKIQTLLTSWFTLFFIIANLLNSCSSFDNLDAQSYQKLDILKSAFSKAELEFKKSGLAKNRNFRQSLERSLSWGSIFTINDTSFIEVSLKLPDSLSSNNGQSFLKGKVYLRISKNLDNYKFEMLTILPSETVTELSGTFTGNLIIEDYFIGDAALAVYTNGKREIGNKNRISHKAGKDKIALTQYYDCTDVLIGRVCVDPPAGYDIPPYCSDRYETVCSWIVHDPGYIPPVTGGGGGTGTGNSGSSSIYSQLETYVRQKPYGLLRNIDCETIMAWLELGKLKINQYQTDKLNTIAATSTASPGVGAPGFSHTDVAKVQNLNNAMSTVVNLDYFSVRVSKLPNGFNSPEALLQYVRKNINNMFDSYASATFTPYTWYGLNDTNLWNSSNPTDAVIAIDLGPEYGSVITTKYTPQNWVFTTIYDPKFYSHPISGNREFGYNTNNDGSYTFYTRGIDRLTGPGETLLQYLAQELPDFISVELTPFEQGDQLWRSFQEGLSKFINQNQGISAKQTPTIKRADWLLIKQVLNGTKSITDLNSDC